MMPTFRVFALGVPPVGVLLAVTGVFVGPLPAVLVAAAPLVGVPLAVGCGGGVGAGVLPNRSQPLMNSASASIASVTMPFCHLLLIKSLLWRGERSDPPSGCG